MKTKEKNSLAIITIIILISILLINIHQLCYLKAYNKAIINNNKQLIQQQTELIIQYEDYLNNN